MLIDSAALWFLLCLEILHCDWLVNWLGNLVLETGIGGLYPGVSRYIPTQDRLDKSCSALVYA